MFATFISQRLVIGSIKFVYLWSPEVEILHYALFPRHPLSYMEWLSDTVILLLFWTIIGMDLTLYNVQLLILVIWKRNTQYILRIRIINPYEPVLFLVYIYLSIYLC